MKTLIIGHKKPDTDAVVAPLALQKLFASSECFGHEDTTVAISEKLNTESAYLFDRFAIEPPPILSAQKIAEFQKVVLVDHNEPSQRPDGVVDKAIVEIYDHHKPAISFDRPLFLTFKPWGSSTTIVYFLMKQQNVVPDAKLASLMLAAILSDTVGFKSSTTTENDKTFAQELAQIAGIADLEEFTLDIFRAKSDVSKLSATELLLNDYKIFEFSKKTLIGQVETVEQEKLLSERKDELVAAIEEVKKSQGVELLFLAVSDVLRVNTKLIMSGKAETAASQEAFGGTVTNNILDIGAKLSRKKDIVPPLEKELQ